jgi:hypothetical protein
MALVLSVVAALAGGAAGDGATTCDKVHLSFCGRVTYDTPCAVVENPGIAQRLDDSAWSSAGAYVRRLPDTHPTPPGCGAAVGDYVCAALFPRCGVRGCLVGTPARRAHVLA